MASSFSWLSYKYQQFVRQGEANSAPLENLPRFRNELQQLIQLYPIEMFSIVTRLHFFIVWILLKSAWPCNRPKESKRLRYINKYYTVYRRKSTTTQRNWQRYSISSLLIGTRPHGCKLQFLNTGFINLTNLCVGKSRRKILLLVDNASSHKINNNTARFRTLCTFFTS